jgi:predicted nucleic acid-binding protein
MRRSNGWGERAHARNTSVEALAREAIHKAADWTSKRSWHSLEACRNGGAAPSWPASLRFPVSISSGKIAMEPGNPVYDCVYLAVAESLDDELLTVDERFVRAVGASELAARMRL